MGKIDQMEASIINLGNELSSAEMYLNLVYEKLENARNDLEELRSALLDQQCCGRCDNKSDFPNPTPNVVEKELPTHYCLQHACPTNSETECEASYYRPDGVIGDCSIVKVRSDR